MSFFGAISKAVAKFVNPLEEPRRRMEEYVAAHPEVLPKKIETPEQLHARYVDVLVQEVNLGYGWTTSVAPLMRNLFDKFAESDTEQQPHWTQASLANYLDAILPPSTPEVKALWTPCVPILHRLLLRIGNFPFLVDPIIPHITHDVFHCAIIHITCREHGIIEYWPRKPPRDLSAQFRQLLFQSLMTPDSRAVADPERKRTKEDDEYMEGVLKLVKKHNFWRPDDMPKMGYPGPKLPTPDMLPSTWSTRVSGNIPQHDMTALMKLLLALQLSPEKIGLGAFDDYSASMNVTAEGMTAALRFPDPPSDPADIMWKGFDSGLRDTLPNIIFSFDRLFRPIIKQRMLIDNMDAFRTADIATTTSVLQAMFLPPGDVKMPPKGQIIDLPLLAQLSTFLPTNIRLAKYEVDPIPVSDLTAACLHKKIEAAISSPSLLLISGVIGAKGRDASSPITVGLFLPPYATFSQRPPDLSRSASRSPATPILFQLCPVQRVIRASVKRPRLFLHAPVLHAPQIEQKLNMSFLVNEEKPLHAGLDVKGDCTAKFWIYLSDTTGNEQRRDANVPPLKDGIQADATESWEIIMKAVEVLRF
jgi:hypothetical protein